MPCLGTMSDRLPPMYELYDRITATPFRIFVAWKNKTKNNWSIIKDVSSIIKDEWKACPERMVIQVLASIFDDVGYYYNLGYLRRALQDDTVAFIGVVNNHAPETFVFNNKTRIYDLTRSAKSTIRENMTSFLNQPDVPPGLQAEDQQMIKEPFEFHFNNLSGYTRSLNQVF